MFGDRYFGKRYFGNRYFGPAASAGGGGGGGDDRPPMAWSGNGIVSVMRVLLVLLT